MNAPVEKPMSMAVNRVFRASPERLYAAWTEPTLVRKWWGPEGAETLALEIDPRVGGQWSWRLRSPDGEEMTASGQYRELSPGRKLSFTWKWMDDADWENVDSLVTVEFVPRGEETEVILTHEGFPAEQSRENHRGGWNSTLTRLEKFVGC